MTPLNEHSLRRQVVGEMHLRRWPPLSAPGLVVQVLRLVNVSERIAEQGILADLPQGWTRAVSDNPRHHEGVTEASLSWVWEQHNEASAFTLFIPTSDISALLGKSIDPATLITLNWIASLPGAVIRATRIILVADEVAAQALLKDLSFVEDELVSCRIGRAGVHRPRIWSDFRIGETQFGRMLVAANSTGPADLSRLVQRLQELGNYRNLALLGLPAAREGWKVLDRIEQELVMLAEEVSRPEISDDSLLYRVSSLSFALMTQATSGNYRMRATEAYARLVDERLAELDLDPIEGFQSLADFTRRRLQPAVRTCASHAQREAELSTRAAAFVALLRTRVETRMENQNARALESTRHSVELQLRMQHLVEGLSVVALSYYSVGLFSYLLKGAEAANPRLPALQILAATTPIIAIVVALVIRRLKRSIYP